MDIPKEMIEDAAKALQQAYENDGSAGFEEQARIALEATLGKVSATSLFFLGPFVQKSNLVFLLNEDRNGGRLLRPIPGHDDKVETVGGYNVDISFAKDDGTRVTALRITKIPPRTAPEE